MAVVGSIVALINVCTAGIVRVTVSSETSRASTFETADSVGADCVAVTVVVAVKAFVVRAACDVKLGADSGGDNGIGCDVFQEAIVDADP